MEFIVQKKEFPKYDFEFLLHQGKNWYDWCGKPFKIQDADVKASACPFGGVEFVVNFYKKYWGLDLKPRNVPPCFWGTEHVGGEIKILPWADVRRLGLSKSFCVKSAEIFKTEVFSEAENIFCYEKVPDVLSEWRFFVHRGRLVDGKPYVAGWKATPDEQKILRMIEDFKDAPVAYTLDVIVTKAGTFLLEVHDFFSCGTYGYNDEHLYPVMLYQWFKEQTRDLHFRNV